MPRLLRFMTMKAAACSPIVGGVRRRVRRLRDFLDLDDVGAEISQHQAAGRPCHVHGEIEDLDAREGAKRLLVRCGHYASSFEMLFVVR